MGQMLRGTPVMGRRQMWIARMVGQTNSTIKSQDLETNTIEVRNIDGQDRQTETSDCVSQDG
jgi:hypothetical protein